MIYIHDVAGAFLAAASAPGSPGQVTKIGSGTSVSIRQTVRLIKSLMSSPVQPEFGALPDRTLDEARIAEWSRRPAVLGWHPGSASRTV